MSEKFDMPQSLRKKLQDPGFQDFWDERSRLSEPWQHAETAEMQFNDRLTFDRQDFRNYFFNGNHAHAAKFEERSFLKRLIKNYKPAKHPYFIGYREYLKKQLQSLEVTLPDSASTSKEIPPEELDRLKKILFQSGILDGQGETKGQIGPDKLKPKTIIHYLIKKLVTVYSLKGDTDAFHQLRTPFALQMGKTGNYKKSDTKVKAYEVYVESLFPKR